MRWDCQCSHAMTFPWGNLVKLCSITFVKYYPLKAEIKTYVCVKESREDSLPFNLHQFLYERSIFQLPSMVSEFDFSVICFWL